MSCARLSRGQSASLQPALQFEERDRAVLELRSDDSFGHEAEAVAIEGDRPFEIVDGQGEDGDARLHDGSATRAIDAIRSSNCAGRVAARISQPCIER